MTTPKEQAIAELTELIYGERSVSLRTGEAEADAEFCRDAAEVVFAWHLRQIDEATMEPARKIGEICELLEAHGALEEGQDPAHVVLRLLEERDTLEEENEAGNALMAAMLGKLHQAGWRRLPDGTLREQPIVLSNIEWKVDNLVVAPLDECGAPVDTSGTP